MWIYLIKSNQYHKIGIASDLWDRKAELQTGNPTDLEIVVAFWFDEYVYHIEKELHDEFSAKRIRGEWFNLDQNDIIEFVEIAREHGGVLPVSWEKDGQVQHGYI